MTALYARQVAHELRRLGRTPIVLVMGLGFPLGFFLLLAALVGNEVVDPARGTRFAQLLAPGMAAFGTVMAGFSFLAIGFASARASGEAKRLAGTPLPMWADLGGRAGAAALLGLIATALVLATGAVFFDVQVPARGLPAVLVALLLGVGSFATLGLALGVWAPSPASAIAVANGVVIPISFVSDVFMVGTQMPPWMERLGWWFPLKHLAALVAGALDPAGTGWGFRADHLLALAGFAALGGLLAVAGMRRGQDAARRAGRARRRSRDARARTGRPSAAALVWSQVRRTLVATGRDASAVVFAVLFPALLVVVVPVANGGGEQRLPGGATLGAVLTVAMAVYGAAVSAYVMVPSGLALAREERVLKRLRGTPLPVWALVAGRVAGATLVGVATLVLVWGVGAGMYHLVLPARWPVAVGVLALGTACLAVLGCGVAVLARGAQDATGLLLGTLLPTAFVSDVFVVGATLPAVLDAIGWTLPLRHVVHAMFEATGVEPGPVDAVHLLVPVAWAVAGAGALAWRLGRGGGEDGAPAHGRRGARRPVAAGPVAP